MDTRGFAHPVARRLLMFGLLTPLASWAEGGHAPAAVTAALVSGGTGAAGTGPPAGTVQLTRPVYLYPEQVRYSGSGDPNLASGYVGYLAGTRQQDDFRWAGYPFRSGYESWCRLSADARALVCTRNDSR